MFSKRQSTALPLIVFAALFLLIVLWTLLSTNYATTSGIIPKERERLALAGPRESPEARELRRELEALTDLKHRLMERINITATATEYLHRDVVLLDRSIDTANAKLKLCQEEKQRRMKSLAGVLPPETDPKEYLKTPAPPRVDPDEEMDIDPNDVEPDPPAEAPRGSVQQRFDGDDASVIPVLVFAYQRAEELKMCLDKIFKVMPKKGYRVFVSQDGTQFPEVTNLLVSYGDRIVHLIHGRNSSGATMREKAHRWQVYYAISHHYGWAIGQVFSHGPNYRNIILLEEDIEVAKDFFQYFRATAALMDNDPTIYCVSAWNDNGKAELTSDPTQVYRSDFFPGLGWMMSRKIWDEIGGPGWPPGFWDDWLRQPHQRKGRSCLRPEVPRTYTWCTGGGASNGQFCMSHLMEIRISDIAVPWEHVDLSYLRKTDYDAWLSGLIKSAQTVTTPGEIALANSKEVKMFYSNNYEFKALARMFGLMEDFKDNVPRTAYRGVVSFRFDGKRVHLVARKKLYK